VPDAETAPPVAALLGGAGETARACEVLERGLAQLDPDSAASVPLLALLVDVQLAAGRLPDAAAACDRLTTVAARHRSGYLTATAALARGRVAVAEGSPDALAQLRAAVAGFATAEMPMELACTRLELAAAVAPDNPEIARDEARAALDGFERLHAARHIDAAAALLRSLGVRVNPSPRAAGPLTNREADVLELLGHGLSNPEIAQRLFISRKTVEHHVGNILGKLGLRSRAEAAAYAARLRK
jgi:DNA-binding NarL/FixJ family response regulator